MAIPDLYEKAGKAKDYEFVFNDLNDNTEYDVYFIAENKLPVNPDLMEANKLVKKTFLTQREIFNVSWTYATNVLNFRRD